MNKSIFVALILASLVSSTVQAQSEHLNTSRKGKLVVNTALDFRITPFRVSAPDNLIGVFVDRDKQNTGTAIAYNLDWYLTDHFALGFGQSFRYSHIAKGSNEIFNSTIFQSPDVKGLIIDYHFYVQYDIPIFKKSEIRIRAGRSLLNTLTSFNITERVFVEGSDEPIGAIFSSVDTNYGAWNLGLGWSNRKIAVMAGVYTSSVTEYFAETTQYTVPYLRLEYTLGKL